MLNTDRISKEVYKTLENLKAMNKISGVFGEVDYLVENGYIDEYDSINIVNDYYAYFQGCVNNINTLKQNIDFGRMPTTDNEIVIALCDTPFLYISKNL